MKATALPPPASVPTRLAPLLSLLAAACVAPPSSPPPAAPSTPRSQVPVAPPPAADWRDVPITPGTWTWSGAGGQSVARFADGLLTLRCDRARGSVVLLRAGTSVGPVAMRVTTTTLTRALTVTPVAGAASTLGVAVPANDGLLDAMAFSRGRFLVEATGLPPLTVPSWPEVARVVQDCR